MTVAINDLVFDWKRQQRPLLRLKKLGVTVGERLLIRGPSGSGKSTLLGLIGGIQSPSKGHITVCGQNISRLSPLKRDQFRADHMGYIFQQFNLIPYLTASENVALALQFSRHKRYKLRSSVDTEVQRILASLGLKACTHKLAQELSVGQQQRVAAARALIGKPELILADEPTSALDEEAKSSFLELLMRECTANRTTLLFVSHESTIEGFFSKVWRLEGGSICQH